MNINHGNKCKLSARYAFTALVMCMFLVCCVPQSRAVTPTLPLASNTPAPTITATHTPEPSQTATVQPTVEIPTLTPTPTPLPLPDKWVGVWPEQLSIVRVEAVTQIDSTGKEVGQMVLGYDQKDRVMMRKRADAETWEVAPFNASLENGMWHVFLITDQGSYQELNITGAMGHMSNLENLEPIARMVAEEFSNEIIEGEAGSKSKLVSWGNIDLKEDLRNKIYLDVLQSYAGSQNYEIRRWFTGIGFYGTTAQELQAFSATKVGGPEDKPYWLPATGSNGAEFMTMHQLIGPGELRPNRAVQQSGGLYVDYVPIVTVSEWMYKNNPWARAYVDWAEFMNGGHAFVYHSGSIGPAIYWGLMETIDLRLSFVVVDKTLRGWPEDFMDLYTFGRDTREGRDFDLKIVQAKLQRILWLTRVRTPRTLGACIAPIYEICQRSEPQDVRNIINPIFEFKP